MTSISTPAISNIMRPGLTTATQRSTGPLPEPMRTSAGFLVAGLFGTLAHFRQHVAAVNPGLDADPPEARARLGNAEIHVGAQRVQRHAAFLLSLTARHLSTAETAADRNLHAAGAALHGAGHGLLH